MRRLLTALSIVAALVGPAAAADMANKSPPASLLGSGYPYGSSGLFFGVYSEAGGGNVNGSVPGVASASLTDTQAGLGGTLGYAWGQKNSPFALSLEGVNLEKL